MTTTFTLVFPVGGVSENAITLPLANIARSLNCLLPGESCTSETGIPPVRVSPSTPLNAVTSAKKPDPKLK